MNVKVGVAAFKGIIGPGYQLQSPGKSPFPLGKLQLKTNPLITVSFQHASHVRDQFELRRGWLLAGWIGQSQPSQCETDQLVILVGS